MPKEVISLLDTSQIAAEFDKFLSSQDLGSMPPTSASRYREGVEISPMDEILALNGLDLEEFFKKRVVAPPTIDMLANTATESDKGETAASEEDIARAINSLDVSSEELASLLSLISPNPAKASAILPASIITLLSYNTATSSPLKILQQLGQFQKLLGNTSLPPGKDIGQLMLDLMVETGIENPGRLIESISSNPAILAGTLYTESSSVQVPLGSTVSLLKSDSGSAYDTIIGTHSDETLLANPYTGSKLVGGGGLDLFVIPIKQNPFTSSCVIGDFSSESGSKIVFEVPDYIAQSNLKYKSSNSNRRLDKLSVSKALFIYDKTSSRLLINGNRRKPGLGKKTGGEIVSFENSLGLMQKDILVFSNNELFFLNREPYLLPDQFLA